MTDGKLDTDWEGVGGFSKWPYVEETHLNKMQGLKAKRPMEIHIKWKIP